MTENAKHIAVFISYSRSDKRHMDTIRRLIGGLIDGSALYVDTESLRAGERWADRLFEAIAGCDVFVVIWSWRARRSVWVQREVRAALARVERDPTVKIVPVLVDDTRLSDPLAAYEAIVASVPNAPGFAAVEWAVAALAVLSLSVVTIALHLAGRPALVDLVGLVSMWVAIAAFWALRAARAPWTDPSASTASLLGILSIRRSSLIIILLGAGVAAILAAALAVAAAG